MQRGRPAAREGDAPLRWRGACALIGGMAHSHGSEAPDGAGPDGVGCGEAWAGEGMTCKATLSAVSHPSHFKARCRIRVILKRGVASESF